MADTRNSAQPASASPPAIRLGCLAAVGVMGILAWLIYSKYPGAIDWSWWTVAGMAVPAIALTGLLTLKSLSHLSEGAIQNAFADTRMQHLRCLTFPVPRHWKVEQLGPAIFRLHIPELYRMASITIELKWLWSENVDTAEGYQTIGEDYVRTTLKGRMIRNEITTRWGFPANEFEYTGRHSTGWNITFPCHGTEYGLLAMTDFRSMYPSVRRLFEEFLNRTCFELPQLESHTIFKGTFSIRLPPTFRLAEETADSARWVTSHRHNREFSVRRLRIPPDRPLTDEALAPLATDRPCPTVPFTTKPFSMKDVGISGYFSFEATPPGRNARTRFIAVFETATGGRYLVVLEDHDPAQSQYQGRYHYLQMGMEIVATAADLQ
jgi:uncharacterized protein (DUF2249 family)